MSRIIIYIFGQLYVTRHIIAICSRAAPIPDFTDTSSIKY